ncbi:MAG: hypothetical protein EAZ79_17450 [Oscillatoriales cyanobacterium]|nr:MAG: hypothetical protein EAZ79_17450 [Oscillatoriales cyanobacterium]
MHSFNFENLCTAIGGIAISAVEAAVCFWVLMPLIIPDFLLTFAFYWLATIALLLPNCLSTSNTPPDRVEVRILNAARRYILVVAPVWDNESILGWEKMLMCDRQQRSIAIGVTINRGISQ